MCDDTDIHIDIYRLLGDAAVVHGIVGVHGLVLLLLGHLLEGQEPVLVHLYPLGHVPHAGVLWKKSRNAGKISLASQSLI